ncbi:MSMEG_0565 family glycosyltransferase [Aureimonas jatrophae]|uniref:Glycosyltransferase, MSMEG_0565 family n=1 Tax=Aureimonas jatrophae TaxID=1166073 RepID=A0A1H0MMZ6_9HYPH|nr:MSMEG_0565 family glycosyltransferase [Aureimonas jatrophae]MBB3952881.1 glycosyltransferase-like protein [Aureimonas jatrophae]SDO81724.1 glycosyltransferase, MSMEG_0565 family [Aureimonas jatrophae]
MRVALLTHSTNPRGGVAHALAVGEALNRLGQEAVVHAPAGPGASFYRAAWCETRGVATVPAERGFAPFVKGRIADYVRHFEDPTRRRFDVFHAGDGISANALATLRDRGMISAFAYTVHHLDSFGDADVDALQGRALLAADAHLTVSHLWQDKLRHEHGISATLVGNGVDRSIFRPDGDGREAALRKRLGIGPGPVFLAVGGVEARKNTVAIVEAFANVLHVHPDAWLVVAGGASLLDHGAYRAQFDAALGQLGAAGARVVLSGPVGQDDMPALYRAADALVFPSLIEGFGLVALEAIACGTPAVVSALQPFTEHFGADDVLWCDPKRPLTIADAMVLALHAPVRARLAARTEAVLGLHDWTDVAARHLSVYERLRETVHA